MFGAALTRDTALRMFREQVGPSFATDTSRPSRSTGRFGDREALAKPEPVVLAVWCV